MSAGASGFDGGTAQAERNVMRAAAGEILDFRVQLVEHLFVPVLPCGVGKAGREVEAFRGRQAGIVAIRWCRQEVVERRPIEFAARFTGESLEIRQAFPGERGGEQFVAVQTTG